MLYQAVSDGSLIYFPKLPTGGGTGEWVGHYPGYPLGGVAPKEVPAHA
jgi:hypothetical protein